MESARPRLLIVGAGGHARVVADAAEECGAWSSIGFLDDRFPELRASGPWTVVGALAQLDVLATAHDELVVAIGDAKARMRIIEQLVTQGRRLATIVHPRATVSRHAVVGAGTMILAGACINPGARLGRGVIVNTGATIDHDCDLGQGVHIAPGAHLSGDVRVGENTWIGVGSCVRQGITIGDHVMIGAGAAVVSDIPSQSTAVGVPARVRP
jgi:sugar O-acyltransferase (sialic acid O-acetyltransferase NeuD family)